VWVANRNEHVFDGRGSVARIGLVIGGTRSDAAGSPDPAGQYFSPPFQYNTCVDRDTDGLIKTSMGLGNILPWPNGGGVDSNGGVSTADDECIINYTRVIPTGTRTLAIDANNDVWVGGIFGSGPYGDHERLDGITGQPIPGTHFNMGCGGYGGFIDGNGILWSSGRHTGLLRYDPSTSTGQCLSNRGNYGLGLDPNTGHIWHSTYSGNRQLYELDAAGSVLNSFQQPFSAQGLAVDGNSHVWVAELFGSRVWHLGPTPGPHVPVGTVTGFQQTTGVAVDANGKIWASEQSSSTTRGAARIDPTGGPVGGGGYNVGAIDLTVGLDAPSLTAARPYNYSDMTGFLSIGGTSPQGSWTVVQDGGVAGTEWGTITWNTEPEASEPAGTSITVEARAADTEAGLSSQTFVPVSNGVLFSLTGQFIEVRTTLRANAEGESPVLSDLTIETAVIDVDIDIKPYSDPNSINCYNDKEVVTVAILTTDEFDALTVDHTTVTFEGAGETHVDKKTGLPRRHEEDADGDLDIDLVFHFRLIETALTCQSTEGVLTGETYDGRDIEGVDAVRMVDSGGGGG
jgi:hypothetical protein